MNVSADKSFDYIVVGAGAAGAVLASRLSDDPSVSVLLLEAGGSDRSLLHLVPKGFYFTSSNPKYTKKFTTEKWGSGAQETWSRGRVLGGSTTVNGMVWNRGWAADYDAWEKAGDAGWNWDAFRAAYRGIEKHQLGGTSFRGANGPVGVSVASPRDPACDALIASMAANGIEYQDDMNGSDDDRVSYVASQVQRGLRVSSTRAFLNTSRKRSNLTVVTHTEASRIIIENGRAVGIEAIVKGSSTVLYGASREVLVCGGAFDSPMLLERSGIGNPEVLAAAGVPVVVASPKVGENLLEHRGIEFQVTLKGVKGFNGKLQSPLKQFWTGFKYLFTRNGVMAHGGFAVGANYESDPASGRPDTQAFFTPISTSAVNPMSGRIVVDSEPGAKYVTYPLHPTSAGSIHITGTSLHDAPKLVPNFLDTAHDRELLLKVIRKARTILATEPFSNYVVDEVIPGREIQTDEQILDFALNKGKAGYHTLGTCAIGPNDDDVVDDRLRVRGVDGLRVVDASVVPFQPSGNSAAPVMAVAWIAADLIKADRYAAQKAAASTATTA
ncbi:MAG: Choline dehydrogenase [Subtercola sp.]|nr:Choline dehydrogenase [Subtercola sp.]